MNATHLNGLALWGGSLTFYFIAYFHFFYFFYYYSIR